MKQVNDGNSAGGYMVVRLRYGGRYHGFRIHKIMLMTFVGPRPDGCVCRHLDGNKMNNSLSNIRWGTRSENERDKERHGVSNHGDRNGMRKRKLAKSITGPSCTQRTAR